MAKENVTPTGGDEALELLRSAHAIANREGRDTNWEAFRLNVRNHLLIKQGMMPGDTISDQAVLRATATPRTYRIPRTPVEETNARWSVALKWVLLAFLLMVLYRILR